MRPDKLYLVDMLEAATSVKTFLGGGGYKDFMANEMQRSAVLQKLTVIGEAASRISNELKAKYPEVEWGDIIGFRNYAVHAYFSVDWEIVWDAATEETPVLKSQIEKIFKAEYQ